MVHALKTVGELILASGYLIDIHDFPVPHSIAVDTGNAEILAGWLLEKDDFQSEHVAFSALNDMVVNGIFELVDEQYFEFNIYADNVTEFRDWLAINWKNARVTDLIYQRIENIINQSSHTARIVIKMPARLTKLRKL